MAPGTTMPRFGFWLSTAGVACAAGFTLWALTASFYSSGETILEANPEATVRIAIAMPLAVTSGVWLLLHLACRYGLKWARAVASIVAWMLVAFAVVSGFTIGLYVMPIAILLVAASRLTPVARS